MKTFPLLSRGAILSARLVVALGITFLFPSALHAQAPALLWATNVGATLFAVDAQTNVYANSGGTVIKLTGDGVPFQTNSICPRPGVAQRDGAGNYYFAGLLPSHPGGGSTVIFDPQDFGGVILSNLPVYLAKYSAAGTLLWATNTGPASPPKGAAVFDCVICSDGNVMVGFSYTVGSSTTCNAWTVDPNGNPKWNFDVGGSGVRLTPQPPTNTYIISYHQIAGSLLYRADTNGNANFLTNLAFNVLGTYPKVFGDSGNNVFYTDSGGSSGLKKRAPDLTLLWSLFVPSGSQCVGPDQYDGIHATTNSASVSRFDGDGNWVWTLPLPASCSSLLLHSSGNRFLSLNGGIVARLAGETLTLPAVATQPVGRKLFAGSNCVFSVGATGFGPLRYSWLQNGVPLPGKTNATLNLTGISASQGGNYSVIVSNVVGSVTSAPALLTVKSVALFSGSQMLTNGTYSFASPPTLTVNSAFPGGSKFYTLDGSAPTFVSTTYSGPFQVPTSATVRALGYSADFSQSEEADGVAILLSPSYTVAVTTTPGGYVTLAPPGGPYLSNTVVTATATPTNGWAFLYWLGDASGTSTSVNLTMNANKTIQAVFGTTLSTTTNGNGQILLYPSGGIYPAGSTVRLTGVPSPGNYFGVWGNAASGNTNPLYFAVASPTPTVSSLFAATPSGQAALTVAITGKGTVNVNPRANAYATNTSVTLTATPDAGESFIRWSGNASGTTNVITLAMTQERVVIANFTGGLLVRPVGQVPQGFRLTVGDPFGVYQVFASTNLTNWAGIGSVSNSAVGTIFTDASATNSPRKFYRASE